MLFFNQSADDEIALDRNEVERSAGIGQNFKRAECFRRQQQVENDRRQSFNILGIEVRAGSLFVSARAVAGSRQNALVDGERQNARDLLGRENPVAAEIEF
jgi:hypothetical protein